MRIQNTNNISFKSSRLNIVSIADTHGDILGVPQVIKTVLENQEDIFERKDSKSTKNMLAIVGDYFMNPGGKGILTKPSKSFGDIQYSFLAKLIHELKRNFPSGNFDTIYTPGNHCFGGGDGWLFDKLYGAEDITTVLGNIDLEKSPYLDRLMKKSKNIVSQKVLEIPDDKNPEIKNHVLILGVTIPSTYYNLRTLKYTHFLDETTKNDEALNKEDLKTTITDLRQRVDAFKEEHPKGAVILLSHTGNKISNIFAANVKGINVILNAHDHKDYTTMVKRTQILSHGQNNQFARGVNLVFDDTGKLAYIKSQKYETAPYIEATRQDTHLQKFVEKLLDKDLEPLVYFDKDSGDVSEMVYSSKIRYKNSVLANYITSAIKSASKAIYPDVDIVGIPATIIRNGLKSNAYRSTFNNIDLLNMFKGVDESIAGIQKGKITGKELSALIVENVRNNIKSPTRNALIQWSDVQIDKTNISNHYMKGEKPDYSKFIKVRNPKTNKWEAVDPNKEYCVLLPDKYLIKKSKRIRIPERILPKFSAISENYYELFKNYLDSVGNKVKITNKIREERII